MTNPTPDTVLSETATTEPCPPKRTGNAKEIVTFYSYNVNVKERKDPPNWIGPRLPDSILIILFLSNFCLNLPIDVLEDDFNPSFLPPCRGIIFFLSVHSIETRATRKSCLISCLKTITFHVCTCLCDVPSGHCQLSLITVNSYLVNICVRQ